MTIKTALILGAALIAGSAVADAQVLPFDNVYTSPYASGGPYVAYYDQEDTSPSYYGERPNYSYGYNGYYPYNYGRPFYGYYPQTVTNSYSYADRHAYQYTNAPYYTWANYPHYSVNKPQLFAYKTWDGVPIYYSETRMDTAYNRAMPVSFVAQPQVAPLPTVYNYRYIDDAVGSAYNMGTVPQRERWWMNRVVEETTTGDKISWNIDNFQYQFQAKDGIYRDHNTWRACRNGALLRRASQMDQWSIREGDFCRNQYGDWEYVGQ